MNSRDRFNAQFQPSDQRNVPPRHYQGQDDQRNIQTRHHQGHDSQRNIPIRHHLIQDNQRNLPSRHHQGHNNPGNLPQRLDQGQERPSAPDNYQHDRQVRFPRQPISPQTRFSNQSENVRLPQTQSKYVNEIFFHTYLNEEQSDQIRPDAPQSVYSNEAFVPSSENKAQSNQSRPQLPRAQSMYMNETFPPSQNMGHRNQIEPHPAPQPLYVNEPFPPSMQKDGQSNQIRQSTQHAAPQPLYVNEPFPPSMQEENQSSQIRQSIPQLQSRSRNEAPNQNERLSVQNRLHTPGLQSNYMDKTLSPSFQYEGYPVAPLPPSRPPLQNEGHLMPPPPAPPGSRYQTPNLHASQLPQPSNTHIPQQSNVQSMQQPSPKILPPDQYQGQSQETFHQQPRYTVNENRFQPPSQSSHFPEGLARNLPLNYVASRNENESAAPQMVGNTSTSISYANKSKHPQAHQSAASGENPDCLWLKNWLQRKGYMDNQDTARSHCKIALPEARSLLKGALNLVNELKQLVGELKQEGLSDNIQKEKLQKAAGIKASLEEMKKVLGSDQVHVMLKQKMEQRKKTRERKKRKRKLEYEALVEEEAARKKKHEEIDKWQEDIYNKIQEAKREEELKTITDKTLAEVTRKANDVNKGLQILEGLRKLRSVRKDSLKRKGLYATAESDKMFETRIRIQTEFLEKQKQTYEAEKRLLQVMLETEQEECKEYEAEELLRMKEEKERKLEKTIKEHLFGRADSPEPGDPLYSFYQYHNAADENFENLCAIRQEWDCYLVPVDSPQGSHLPTAWVLPTTPSSDVWATALKT